MMKRWGSLLASVMLLVVLSAGCQKAQMPDTTTGNQAAEQQLGNKTPEGGAATTGTLATIVVGPATYSVEIAQTNEEKAAGLMNRESLPEGNGMWFVFDKPGQEMFWMKSTSIPLDIIFVGDTMQVVDIKENAVPLSEEQFTASVPYQYVLEVNAGQVAKHGIKKGDTVQKRIGPQ